METTTTETDFITREDELVLIRKAQAGDLSARDELLEAHADWIHNCARKYWYPRRLRMEYDDVFQNAVMGAMRAVEKFDCTRETKFTTYATHWILNRMREAPENESLIRVGRHRTDNYQDDVKRARSVSSLDVVVGDRGTATLVTLIESTADTVREAEQAESKATVQDAMRCLTDRERQVMKLRLSGLVDREIAEQLRVSKARAHQIEQAARDKMARYLRRKSHVADVPALPSTFGTAMCRKCGSSHVRKCGRTPRGTQRHSCYDCGEKFSPNKYVRRVGDSRSPRFKVVCELLREGKGNREIARLTGANKQTVSEYRKLVESESGPALCPCGRPATHNGWCKHRYQQSHARQETMKALHRKQQA